MKKLVKTLGITSLLLGLRCGYRAGRMPWASRMRSVSSWARKPHCRTTSRKGWVSPVGHSESSRGLVPAMRARGTRGLRVSMDGSEQREMDSALSP